MQERRPVVQALKSTAGRSRRGLVIPVLAALVVLLDQSTKTWAEHHLRDGDRHVVGSVNLVLTYNRGAAFSLGTGVTPIVETVVVILVVWLLAVSRRASRSASLTVVAGLGLLVGGAFGNLADRLFRTVPMHHGAVIDFIQAASWWPVFNVADSAIVVGVAVIAVAYAFRSAAFRSASDA